MRENKQKATKVSFLLNVAENLPGLSSSLGENRLNQAKSFAALLKGDRLIYLYALRIYLKLGLLLTNLYLASHTRDIQGTLANSVDPDQTPPQSGSAQFALNIGFSIKYGK